MPTTVRDMRKTARRLGWVHSHTTGDHHVYYHPTLGGPLVIPGNDHAELAKGTENSIRKQLGIR